MCTIIVAKHVVDGSSLIVGANRDEFYNRPWDPPHALGDTGIFCGIDRVAGGTWLGLNSSGLLVAVTNRRHASARHAVRSRGLLCLELLQESSPARAEKVLRQRLRRGPYNHFNLLIADRSRATVYGYVGHVARVDALPDGVHIVSDAHGLNPFSLNSVRQQVRAKAALGFGPFRAHLAQLLSNHSEAHVDHVLCKHFSQAGTLCSSIVRLSNSQPAEFWFANAPPCQASYAPLILPSAL